MNMLSVKILVTVPDDRSFDACTLCFKTIRTGFPTAKIHVDINDSTPLHLIERVGALARAADCFTRRLPNTHLGEWIKNKIDGHIFDWPLFIVDPDTIFWKSCEDWEYPSDMLLGGYQVPRIWNDFAKCISMPRIHTSFMVFPKVAALRQAIKLAYPYSHEKAGEYCPCDPFMGRVMFIDGKPVFWDCGAVLFNMLPIKAVRRFSPEKLDCFDHLNSASFYDVMMERMDDNRGFHLAHTELVKTPGKLKNLWPIIDEYYRKKEIEGRIVLSEL